MSLHCRSNENFADFGFEEILDNGGGQRLIRLRIKAGNLSAFYEGKVFFGRERGERGSFFCLFSDLLCGYTSLISEPVLLPSLQNNWPYLF